MKQLLSILWVIAAYSSAYGQEFRIDRSAQNTPNIYPATPFPDDPALTGSSYAIASASIANPTAYVGWWGSVAGIIINADITCENLKSRELNVVAWFSTNYYCEVHERFHYTPLKDGNGRFRSVDGQVSASTTISPTAQGKRSYRASLFIPLDELHLVMGRHQIALNLGLFHGKDHYDTSPFLYGQVWYPPLPF